MSKRLNKCLIVFGLFFCLALPAQAQGDVQDIEVIRNRDWPKLGQKYEFLGPSSKKYNCIAWSLGTTSKWVWPGDRLEDFDRLYEKNGFHRLSKPNYRAQDGVEKIVLYGRKKDGGIVCTHAARQMSDGSWTNKLGSLPLIKVSSPDQMAGPAYGSPIAVYVRKKPTRPANLRVATRGVIGTDQ